MIRARQHDSVFPGRGRRRLLFAAGASGGVLLLSILLIASLPGNRADRPRLEAPVEGRLSPEPGAALGAPCCAEGPDAAPAPGPADHACRFWGMIGTAPHAPTLLDQLVTGAYSLRTLASANPNGWGVAYFSPALAAAGLARPEVLRGGPPANNPHDARYAAAVEELLALGATCAVAHVRAATTGHAGVPDPHPFCNAELAFAHNGTVSTAAVAGLLTIDDPQYLSTHPLDYTNPNLDSELYWQLLLKLRGAGVRRADGRRGFSTAEAIAEAALRMHLEGAILTAANCVLAQRDTLYALRFDNNAAERYRVRYKQSSGAWIVASEPVGSDTTGWLALPPRSMGIFTATGPPVLRTVFPPPGPYVVVHAHVADDASGGNGDGAPDAGEVVRFRFELENIGAQAALGVQASLSAASPHATFEDSVAFYGDILPGERLAGLNGDHFVVRIHGDCPDQEALLLKLRITTGGGENWTAWFPYTINAPVLRLAFFTIDDGTGGDGDGVLEPGESAALRIVLDNAGHGAASGLSATLVSLSDTLAVTQPIAGAAVIPPGAAVALEPDYGVALAAHAISPSLVPCALQISGDWDLSLAFGFHLPVGGFRDDMESGEGGWTHGVVTPGFIDQWHLSSHRNHTPGGSMSWKFGGPNGTVYADSSDGALTTPPIEVLQFTTLTFWHWIDAEAVIGGQNDAYDGGLVELSLDGGPWQQVAPDGGYPYQIRASLRPGPFPPGTPVFSGAHNWSQETFSLQTDGGSMRLRFRFGSNGTVRKEGWYIDDLAVTSYTNASAVDAPPEGRAGLGQASPNPFAPETRIRFSLPDAQTVTLRVLDAQGRVVRTLVDERLPAGEHAAVWDGRDARGAPAGSGVYFSRLDTPGRTETRKLALVR